MARCNEFTKTGTPCRGQAVAGYQYCRHHLPRWEDAGAPAGLLRPTTPLPVIGEVEIDVLARALCTIDGWRMTMDDGTDLFEGYEDVCRVDRRSVLRMAAEADEHRKRVVRNSVALLRAKEAVDPLAGIKIGYYVLALALQAGGEAFRLDLDETARVVGLVTNEGRTEADVLAARRIVMAWINVLTAVRVVGGRYNTKNLCASYDSHPFLIEDGRFDIGGAATERQWRYVRLRASTWLKEHCGLFLESGMGNLQQVLSLPCDRTPGRWATASALTLLVQYRVKPSLVALDDVGGLQPVKISRRELLTHYLPDADVIKPKSRNPRRLRENFTKGMHLLVEHGIIAGYDEPSDYPERGWQTTWLNDLVTIHPTDTDTEKLAAKAARCVRHHERRRRLKEAAALKQAERRAS